MTYTLITVAYRQSFIAAREAYHAHRAYSDFWISE